jgi:hypothetical protein
MGQFGIKTLFELWKVGTASDIATGWDGDVVQVWAEKTTTPLDLEKRELLEGAGLSFTWISGWDSEEAARKFGQEIGRLYGRGPFAKELAAAKSSGTAVPETSGTLVRLNGTSASLRVLQEGQKIAVIFGHGPAKKLVDQLGDAEVLSHLRAIAIRE